MNLKPEPRTLSPYIPCKSAVQRAKNLLQVTLVESPPPMHARFVGLGFRVLLVEALGLKDIILLMEHEIGKENGQLNGNCFLVLWDA